MTSSANLMKQQDLQPQSIYEYGNIFKAELLKQGAKLQPEAMSRGIDTGHRLLP